LGLAIGVILERLNRHYTSTSALEILNGRMSCGVGVENEASNLEPGWN
jgi:hypothetical protein